MFPEDEVKPMPDRLAIDKASPFYSAALIKRGVGVRFKGTDKTNVAEYCVSEGWVLVQTKVRGRDGKPITLKLQGTVEPYMRDGRSP